MRRFYFFLLIIGFLVSVSFASEWGILELSTEVYSGLSESLQKYSFLLERWWDDSLGFSLYLGKDEYFKYRIGIQTPYLRGIYGYFYPNLNFYTKNLEFKGGFLGLYIQSDEIYLLSGEDLENYEKITTLGWQRAISQYNIGNFSISSYSGNYLFDINLLHKINIFGNLPLGTTSVSEEISILMKRNQLYLSGALKGELGVGNLYFMAYLGSNHKENLDLTDIYPGEFGGEAYIRFPLTLEANTSFSLGYFHNFENGIGRIKAGTSLEWKLSDFINLEILSNLEYFLSKNYNFTQKVQINFPTLEGALVGSIYWQYYTNRELTGNLLDESQTIGLKISYQY
ncbi:MAG: hypothetical protein CBR30_07675 [Dictyoglomus sp. NZ13-RE01]|nr:MAG: hypothetical protein CBR30_07675 [Dictyoglomus sp. NZ13-RE01]